jgi:hypothetical protein
MKGNNTNLNFSSLLCLGLCFLTGLLLWKAPNPVAGVSIQPVVLAVLLPVLGAFFLVRPFLRLFLRQMQRVYTASADAIFLFSTNRSLYKSLWLVSAIVCVGAIQVSAQVRGAVFRDFNGNGTQDTNEPLVSGVLVSAYLADSNTPCGTATSAGTSAPNFSVPGCGTADVRVEFEIPTSGTCVNSSIDFTSLGGTTYGSSVQFVQGNSTNVNFAIHNPNDYNTGAANTSAYIPRYVSGDPLPIGSPAGAESWFYGFGYNNTGDPSTPPAQTVNGTVLGSTWGVAYSKQAKKIFVAAFIKRHVGLGSLGSGGIYLLEPTATTFNVSTFYDMDANGHRTRADDGTAPAYGSGSSFTIASNSIITFSGAPDPLSGQPIGLGVVGTNVNRTLPTNPIIPGFDPAAFDQTGKVGLGDIDISDDGQYLFVMNLYSRRVFRLRLNDPFNPTSVTEVVSYAVPDPGCTNGTYRPFGLKFYRNKLYVGVVCSAENLGGTNANLSAQVYELNNPTAAAAFNATAVVTISDMTYDRQTSSDWRPWSNNSDRGSSPIRYAQPILSGIEVNERGDIIMGFMDRAGNQYGNDNYKFLQTTTTTTDNHSSGEILIAGVDCSTGSFAVENNGQITSNGISLTSSHTASHGSDNPLSQGIGGREFFFDNSAVGDPHSETAQGAIAMLMGTGEVMSSSFAIVAGLASDAGVIRLSSNDGTFVSGYALYGGTLASGNFFGKASGLGDLELSGATSPLEIGNRVWMDTDDDGIQDAGEMGIGSIPVKLFQGATQVGATTTAANGSYYFNNSNVNLNGATGLLPNTAYVIRVDAADFPVGKSVSTNQNIGGAGQPDVRDNDATLNGSNAEIAVTTGKYGENNHTLDMAFRQAVCSLTSATETLETCNNNGSAANPADDFITFSLNPTGTDLGASYSVTASGGATVSLAAGGAATNIAYGVTTAFRLQNGSANGTLYTITITDVSGAPCVVTTTVQQSACSTPGCVNPSGITLTPTAPICTNGVPQNNGIIRITAGTNVTNFGISTAGAATYDGPAYPATTFTSFPQIISSTIPNTGGTYIVRIFNGAANCFIDQTITVDAVTCACPAPYPLCTSESYTLTADAGYSNYQWFFDADGNGPTAPVLVANTAVYANANQPGTYTWTAVNGSGCVVLGCCPTVLESITTNATFTPTAPTCTGATANNNGIITFATATGVTNFGISTVGSATYNGPVYPATTFTAVGQNVSTTIPNTGGSYIVRVFNGAAACFTDVPVTIAPVTCTATCALTAATKTLETCNSNGTTGNGADDFITFSLNPTGTGLGASYSVTANNGGIVTLAAGGMATGIAYGSATAFRLQNGSSNGTLYTITVTDVSGAPCVATTTVQQNTTCSAPPPCALTAITFANPSPCNDNGTNTNATDDYFTADITVTFSNPPATGNLVLTGDVLTGGGATSVTVATAGAGPTYTFVGVRLRADGSSSAVTATFSADNTCTFSVTNGPNVPSCSNCVIPVLATNSGNICIGNVLNLATLVTGNTPAGTLTFYTSQSDATAGTNALINSTIAPIANTTYYVRSEIAVNCFSTTSVSVTVANNPAPTVTNGSVCAGGTIDLATLVTATGGGTLSFYTTLANANAGTNPLASSNVSPASATNYYVRSSTAAGCYGVREIVITITPVVCIQPTITGSN